MSNTSWETKKLSEIADMCLGKMLDQKKNKGEYYPYLANLNVRWGAIELEDLREMRFEKKEFERFGLKYGDIVMCEGGEPGRCAIWKNQAPSMMIQKALHRIRAKENIDSLFLFYALLNKGLQGHFDGYFTGAAIKHLTGESLAKVEVKLPEYSVQKKIAAILETYDDLIENNLKRIKLLEEVAQITYEEWFVRMKFPGHEAAIFDEETGLPEGWNKRPISDFCEKITDGTHDSPKQVEQGVPLITGKHIENGFINFESAYLISYEDHEQIKKRSGLSEWDILFSNIGTLGHTGVVTEDFEYSCKNVVIFKRKHGFEYFLYSYLSNEHTVNKLDSMSSGVAQKFYSLKFIRALEEILPSDALIKEFNSLAEPIFSAKYQLNNQIKLLKEARDILLPRLMTGMIDIEQVELPEAMLQRLEQQEN